jgi:dephospho-CoA kinase
MGTGKTTVAKQILVRHKNSELYSIGQKIKNLIIELELPYRRDILQETGDFFRKFDPYVWVKFLVKQIKASESAVIIDDIRWREECDYLKSQGFIILRITASEQLRKERIEKRDNIKITSEVWKQWNNHKTEIEAKTMPVDYELANEGSLEELKDKIDKFLDNFFGVTKKSKRLPDFLK